MSVFKRYKGKKVERPNPNYNKATWIAQGMVNGERYHKSLKNAKTKAEAEAGEDIIIAKIREGEFVFIKDNTKFSTFVDEIYLPYCQLNNANCGQKIVECKFLKRFFGDAPLKSIKPNKAEDYKRWRSAQKVRCQKCLNNKHQPNDVCNPPLVAYTTVNRELSTLKKLFNVAIINYKIKENPMRFVKMLPKPEPRERYLRDDEKKRLLEVLRDSKQLLAIVLIGLSTGWRKGQILSVRKQDLDHRNQAVTVIKSKRSPARKIIVSDFVWRIFEGLVNDSESEWVFFNKKTGKKLGDFKRAWWMALKKAEIENFHFHDIRHTFATELFELGGREFTVQTALGHSEIKTTRGYTHVKDDALRKQLNELGGKQNFSHSSIFTLSSKSTNKDLQEKPSSPYLSGVNWSGREDLNLRPHGPEPCALPG